jgi:uncharacterized protein (UPF0248 family)
VIPIQSLLNRIRWDEEFGKGDFEIGYYDHVSRKIIRISLREARFEEGNRFSFELRTAGGEVQTIPFHRVREVYKDGHLIWSRGAY